MFEYEGQVMPQPQDNPAGSGLGQLMAGASPSSSSDQSADFTTKVAPVFAALTQLAESMPQMSEAVDKAMKALKEAMYAGANGKAQSSSAAGTQKSMY